MREEKFFLAAKAIKESIIRNQSAEDGIRDPEMSRGLGDVYKRQTMYYRFGNYGVN